MRKLLMLVILAVPLSASAEYVDVIQSKFKEKCNLQTYVAIKNDFNEQWGRSHGYRAEIADPVQGAELSSVLWVGRCASTESFGKALDTWRTELSDPKSVASKLNERFQKCVTNESRQGYDTY
jgi:hypothetical protein